MTAAHRDEYTVEVGATLDQVWEMLTTGRGLAAWFGVDADVDLRPGGTFRVAWGDEVAESTVHAVEPPRRLRLVYDPDDPSGAEEWLLEHADGITRVRLIHTMPDLDVDDWETFYGDVRRGWRLFLASLRWALDVAPTPWRTATCTTVPVSDRATGWAHILDALGMDATPRTGDVVDGVGRVVLADAPHSVLVASTDATLLCDQEGAGDSLVIYVQAAIHGDDDPARRAALLDRVAGPARAATDGAG